MASYSPVLKNAGYGLLLTLLKRKSTHRDTVSAAHALRMRGLHDKRQLLAKLRIAGIVVLGHFPFKFYCVKISKHFFFFAFH